jgi:gamma-glutamyltranspeptidase/glutathione hydrolase
MLHSVRGDRGMVTRPHHLASQAGSGVLRDGGTAAEAAVAVAATLAVAYPHMTGIGGDSFWLIHGPADVSGGTRVHAIDACGGAAAADLSLHAGLDVIP